MTLPGVNRHYIKKFLYWCKWNDSKTIIKNLETGASYNQTSKKTLPKWTKQLSYHDSSTLLNNL